MRKCVWLLLFIGLFLVSSATMVCPTCGKTYTNDFAYCEEDGSELLKVKPKPQPEGPQTKVVGPGIKLVRIPGGTFLMGSNDAFQMGSKGAKPVHTVTVSSFWMGETEVTIEQYVAFLNEVKPSPSQLQQWIGLDDYTHITQSDNSYYADNGWKKYPVVNVSWYGARDFCAQYGFRLPTEAEWEYAAGGPKHYKYPWGNTFDKSKSCYSENQGRGNPATMEVKSFTCNDYWLYDMAGNVIEWCNDWYSDYQSDSQRNPQGATSGERRILRGGTWGRAAAGLQCAWRSDSGPTSRRSDFGFRVSGD